MEADINALAGKATGKTLESNDAKEKIELYFECVISSLRGFQDFRKCHFLNARKSSSSFNNTGLVNSC